MGQSIPSGEFPSCARASTRFLRRRSTPRPARRQLTRSNTAEVRGFVVSPDQLVGRQADTLSASVKDLTEERDRAQNAVGEMELHLQQLGDKVAATREERDWARHNLRTLDEEVISLRARVTELTDEMKHLSSHPRPAPPPPEPPAEEEEDQDQIGWDERSDLNLELSTIKDDLAQMTEARDRALAARDALAQQVLLASGARRTRGGFWAKNAVNLFLCAFLLTGMAMMGHFFPRIVASLSGHDSTPPGVEVRLEPEEIKVTEELQVPAARE
jgi:hypothetical protein